MSAPTPAKSDEKKPADFPYGLVFKIFSIIGILLAAVFFTVNDPQAAAGFIFILQLFQLLSLCVVIFCVYKIFRFNSKFQHQVHDIEHIYEHKYHPKHEDKNKKTDIEKRLDKIKEHIYSSSVAEWKLGIIELDTVLKDVLNQNSYTGETVADQLKSAGEKNFSMLDNAWEAHKIRNKIAHEGIKFTMDQNEAVRVYRLYMSVFEEFKVV